MESFRKKIVSEAEDFSSFKMGGGLQTNTNYSACTFLAIMPNENAALVCPLYDGSTM